MIKESITYDGFDGVERTEDFYFNLTQAELAELQITMHGGMREYLQRIIDAKDMAAIVKTFREILRVSYGFKTEDGRGFRKTEEAWEVFLSSEAYSILIFKLWSDSDWASTFINGIVPKDLADKAAAQQRGEGIATANAPRQPQDYLKKATTTTTVEPDLPVVSDKRQESEDEMRARLRAEWDEERAAEREKNTGVAAPFQNGSDTPE